MLLILSYSLLQSCLSQGVKVGTGSDWQSVPTNETLRDTRSRSLESRSAASISVDDDDDGVADAAAGGSSQTANAGLADAILHAAP